jgi:hypothetical protein
MYVFKEQVYRVKCANFWDVTQCSPLKELLATCFYASFLLGLSFDPEDGGIMFLRNIRWL